MYRVAVQVFAYAGPLQRIRLACLAPLDSHIQSDSSNTLFLHPWSWTDGATFYFCSQSCKNTFDRDPHRYGHSH